MGDILNTILTPAVVYLATLSATAVKAGLPGWVVVSIIVPAVSALVAAVAQWLGMTTDFWPHFVLGLLAVYVNEFFKQIKQAVR